MGQYGTKCKKFYPLGEGPYPVIVEQQEISKKESVYEKYSEAIFEALEGRNTWEEGLSWPELCKLKRLNIHIAKQVLRLMQKNDRRCRIFSMRGYDVRTGTQYRLYNVTNPKDFDLIIEQNKRDIFQLKLQR
ncbi:MAG: hypothetical protein ACRD5H_13615 [Nitrososphaerales archaeon]